MRSSFEPPRPARPPSPPPRGGERMSLRGSAAGPLPATSPGKPGAPSPCPGWRPRPDVIGQAKNRMGRPPVGVGVGACAGHGHSTRGPGGAEPGVPRPVHTPATHFQDQPARGGPSPPDVWEEMPSPRGTGSGRRTVVWALCFLLLLPEAGSAKTVWRRALHARLAEKPRAEEAGGPRQPRADLCPPPPRSLPPGACQAASCQADSQCPRHRRCCYNGCVYACLEAVPPPPVLDWLVQPKPRWLGGNGWLLDGPEEVLQAEACSTTEDGAEPLLCPTGYDCHILNPGDVAAGIPNRGQCVKQRQQTDGRLLQHRFYKEYPEGDSKNVAEPGRGLLRRFP